MKIIILITLSFLTMKLSGQSKGKINIETNIFRYSKENGLRYPHLYSKMISFLNKAQIGYSISNLTQLRIGVRTLPKINNSWETDYAYEDTKGNGAEINLGIEKMKKISKNLFMYGEFGIFIEKYKQKGIFWQDYPPTYEVNHLRTFVGGYLEFKIGYRLYKNLEIIYSMRDRFGVNKTKGVLTNNFYTIYPETEVFKNFYEPINSIALRIKIE